MMSLSEFMDEQNVAYPYSGILLYLAKEENSGTHYDAAEP